MKISDSLHKAAGLYETFVELLDTISRLTQTTADDKAVDVLRAIHVTIQAFQDDIEKASITDVEKALKTLRDQIKKNDQTALEALHKKFDVPKDE